MRMSRGRVQALSGGGMFAVLLYMLFAAQAMQKETHDLTVLEIMKVNKEIVGLKLEVVRMKTQVDIGIADPFSRSDWEAAEKWIQTEFQAIERRINALERHQEQGS